jgi:pilus assembly protein Flp/PilA
VSSVQSTAVVSLPSSPGHHSPLVFVRSLYPKEAPVPNFVKRYLSDQSGATAIEYGLIAALIAIAIIATVTSVGTGLQATFTGVASQL